MARVDRTTLLWARWLLPPGAAKAASIDVDAHRTLWVRDEEEHPASPLQLVLGLDTGATRSLELALFTGVDWTLGKRLEPGEAVLGAEAVGRITAVMVRRRADLAALEAAVVSTVENGPEVHPDRLTEARSALQRLTSKVGFVPGLDERTGRFVDTYEADDLIALAAVEFVLCDRDGETFAICASCGRPFMAEGRADERYCRRSAPGETAGGRTCHDVGPQRTYAQHLSGLPAIYRARYKALDKRVARGTLAREALDVWRHHARELQELATERGWSDEQFAKALHQLEPYSEED